MQSFELLWKAFWLIRQYSSF